MTTTPVLWRGGEQANTVDNGREFGGQIAGLAGGGYIVTWAGPGTLSGRTWPRAQIFDAQGNAVGDEILLRPQATLLIAVNDVIALPSGGFIVQISYAGSQWASSSFYQFDASGSLQGSIDLGGAPIIAAPSPTITLLANGTIAHTYDDPFIGTTNTTFTTPDGVRSSPVVTGQFAGGWDNAGLTNGNLAVVIAQQLIDYLNGDDFFNGLYVTIHTPSGGTVVSGALLAAVNTGQNQHYQTDPHVTALSGGGFAAVWRDLAGDSDGSGIRAAVLSASGTIVAAPFLVNAGVEAGDQAEPAIVGLQDGGFVIAWVDPTFGDILGKRYDAAGGAVGGLFVIADGNASAVPTNPELTLLADGRIAVSYDLMAGDRDVYSVIFDPRSGPVTGTAEADNLTSIPAGTTVDGLAGDDRLYGHDGNDTLIGGLGADRMEGGAGNDVYVVDNAGDQVIEAVVGGVDRVYARVSYALAAGSEVEFLQTFGIATLDPVNLTGNAFGQTLYGNRGDNVLNGAGGTDVMQGFAGNDSYLVDHAGDFVIEAAGEGFDTVLANTNYVLGAGQHVEVLMTYGVATTANVNLTGNELGQILYGNAGRNILNGGFGNDTLWGFGGADAFLFNTALDPVNNVDALPDFTPGLDRLVLENAVFTGLTQTGMLDDEAFYVGSSATEADDRIVYDPATGGLFYDFDGSGPGAAIRFATLAPGLALSHTDIYVV